MANFFENYFVCKNWQGGGELLIVIKKWYNRRLRLLTMLLPGRIYIALGPWHFGDFRKFFLPNIGEDKKKSHHLSGRPWHCAHRINSALVVALRL